MLKVVETKIIEENGQEYEVKTYSNGTVVKEIIMPEVEPEPIPDPELTPDPVMEKLNNIEAKIQTNEDLQTFYDDIVKEVGL